jgi:hypothetical protein
MNPQKGSGFAYWQRISAKTRLYVYSVAILTVGLCAATIIYLTVPEAGADVLGYDLIGGQAFPIDPGDSKMYLHDLKQFGGTEAVLADEFDRWFASLWRGRTLGLTIGSIAAILAGITALVAYRMPADE